MLDNDTIYKNFGKSFIFIPNILNDCLCFNCKSITVEAEKGLRMQMSRLFLLLFSLFRLDLVHKLGYNITFSDFSFLLKK